MKKKMFICVVVGLIFMIIFSILSFRSSFNLPKVGPVGDGKIDDSSIIRDFIIRLLGSLGFLTYGIIGVYKNWTEKDSKH